MTEKRFKLEDVGFVRYEDKLLNPYDIVDKLNKQHEQIQELQTKKEIQNKQITNAEQTIQEQHDLLNNLNDENEQLKQHIRIVLRNELNKSDIPVWKHQYVKFLAEKLGVELNELYE